MMAKITREFPSETATYNRGVSNPSAKRYYATKSQTTIAARAASELDYNKIQKQIGYQQLLMEQIEKTKEKKYGNMPKN